VSFIYSNLTNERYWETTTNLPNNSTTQGKIRWRKMKEIHRDSTAFT